MTVSNQPSIAIKRLYKSMVSDFQRDFPVLADLILHTSIKKKDATRLALLLEQLSPASILEIGSFCGVSTSWILRCSLTSSITCVDPWLSEGKVNAEQIYDQMIAPYRPRVTKVKAYFASRNNQAYSVPNDIGDGNSIQPGSYKQSLPLYLPQQHFDLVFVDGDHRTSSSINVFMHAKEITSHIIYHDANLETHQRALQIIANEWHSEWRVQFFNDGEDGLALVSRVNLSSNVNHQAVSKVEGTV